MACGRVLGERSVRAMRVQVLPDRAAVAGDCGVVAPCWVSIFPSSGVDAPARTTLPAAFAAVRNGAGQVLVVRRFDGGNWDLPGGRIEVGETAGQAVIREVARSPGCASPSPGYPATGIYRLAAAQAAGVSEALLVVKRLVRAPVAVAQPRRPGVHFRVHFRRSEYPMRLETVG